MERAFFFTYMRFYIMRILENNRIMDNIVRVLLSMIG